MTDKLTRLQTIILRLEERQLPLRDAMRMASAEVGFFVGQTRYENERRKALALAGDEAPAEEAAG